MRILIIIFGLFYAIGLQAQSVNSVRLAIKQMIEDEDLKNASIGFYASIEFFIFYIFFNL